MMNGGGQSSVDKFPLAIRRKCDGQSRFERHLCDRIFIFANCLSAWSSSIRNDKRTLSHSCETEMALKPRLTITLSSMPNGNLSDDDCRRHHHQCKKY